jgi:hypothetical protein
MSSVSATSWYNVQCARYGGGFVDSWEGGYDGTGGRHEMLVSLGTLCDRRFDDSSQHLEPGFCTKIGVRNGA